MKLEGIHHITAITGDAQRNVDFYAGVLGLRLVKKTVNQDATSVYHLFYADERGDAGSDITFFEFPGAAPGSAGAGMVHRVVWRVASPEALDFWSERLREAGYDAKREGDSLHFEDPEGLDHELAVVNTSDEPLIANHPEIPAELALQGFHGVRAYAENADRSRHLLEDGLGFVRSSNTWEARGTSRGALYTYDPAPALTEEARLRSTRSTRPPSPLACSTRGSQCSRRSSISARSSPSPRPTSTCATRSSRP